MKGDEFPVPTQCGSVNCSQEFFAQTKELEWANSLPRLRLVFFICDFFTLVFIVLGVNTHVIALTNQNIGYITYMMEMDTLQFLTKHIEKKKATLKFYTCWDLRSGSLWWQVP